MKPDEIWSAGVADLQVSLTTAMFEAYIKKMAVVSGGSLVDEGKAKLILSCPSPWHKSEVEKRVLKKISDSLERVSGGEVEVELVVGARVSEKINDLTAPLFSKVIESSEAGRVTGVRVVGLQPELTLDNFAVSTSNEMAYAAAKAVSKKPGAAYNPLFLYGGVGVGKTHLMQGVGQVIAAKQEMSKIIYCSGEEFTNEIIDAIRNKSTPKFRKRYRTVSLLLIDDIQFIAGKAAVQEEFFHTFNAITKEGGQVIMTSDKPPRDIDNLEERLRSRFEGGLSIDIGQPDFELRCAILMIKSDQTGKTLSPEVAQFLASHETDTRALLGGLKKLMTIALGKGKKADLALAKELFSGPGAVEQKKQALSTEDVIGVVAGFYGADPEMVRGPKRTKNLTLPRHVAMYLLKEDFRMNLVEIGDLFGKRDHTSVMHAVEKINKLVSEQDEVYKQVARIRVELYE